MSEVPEAVEDIIQTLGIYVPSDYDTMSSDAQELFDNATQGKCMSCGSVLGEHSFIVLGKPPGLDEPAVMMVFCGGACMTDMQVMGWLQQRHTDIVQALHFRGGRGGN